MSHELRTSKQRAKRKIVIMYGIWEPMGPPAWGFVRSTYGSLTDAKAEKRPGEQIVKFIGTVKVARA
jgi:hypothetical protein